MILLTASPALAQTVTPVQQYLQNETGYVPQVQPTPPAQAQVTGSPYAVTQSPATYAASQTEPSPDENHHINSGVSGMNN